MPCWSADALVVERVGSDVCRTVVVVVGDVFVLLGFVGSEVAGASVPDFVVWSVRVGSAVPSEIDTTTESTVGLTFCVGSVPDLLVVVDCDVEVVAPSLVGVVVVEL